MTKTEVRKVFAEKREELSTAEFLQSNQGLYNRFFSQIDLSFIKTLHLFLSIEDKKEPDTWQILDRVRREFPHVRLVVPRLNEKNSLDHIYFEGLHQLKLNSWKIMEPAQGVPAPVEKIDMVLVPLLAFDEKGHRVGYGRGYYDKFLSECRKDCRKIGLSLFPPVDEIEGVEEWDVKLDACVTPGQFFSF